MSADLRYARVLASTEYAVARAALVRARERAALRDWEGASRFATEAAFNAGVAHVYAMQAGQNSYMEDTKQILRDAEDVVEAAALDCAGRSERLQNPTYLGGNSVTSYAGVGEAYVAGIESVGYGGVEGMGTRDNNPSPVWLPVLSALIAGVTGFVMGRITSVPNFDQALDTVEGLIESGDKKGASKMLRRSFDALESIYQRMGGTAVEVRRRMEKLNAKLPAKLQVFALSGEGRKNNPNRRVKRLKEVLLA